MSQRRSTLSARWCFAKLLLLSLGALVASVEAIYSEETPNNGLPIVVPTTQIAFTPTEELPPPEIVQSAVFQPVESSLLAPSDPPAERIRELEERNRRLTRQLDFLTRRVDDLSSRLPANTKPNPPIPGLTERTETDPLSPDYLSTPRSISEAPLGELPGQFGRPLPPGRDIIQVPGEEALDRSRVDLEQGVRFLSPDGRYRIELHDLTQGEFRSFAPSGNPLANSFAIPRQRFYFSGQVDEWFDFYSVLNRGYGTGFDLLDSYVDLKFDQAINLRLGRTKTPYSYEYYKIAEGDLIAPERSVFMGNLSPNRQIGAMAFGRILDNRLEYAAGIFNGPENSFQDYNNAKDIFLYGNAKPFLLSGIEELAQLNIGASFNYGRQSTNQPQEPIAFHTANDETTNTVVNNLSPTFLQLNSNAKQTGDRALWAIDSAYYYRGLTVLAEYNAGFSNYSLSPKKPDVHVSYTGFSVATTYFLTGEEPIARNEIEPLRPFRWQSPGTDPGAWEIYHRTAYMNAGNIYNQGLADPTLWSHDALVFDTGVNWYMNRYVRVFMDWQLARYGSPVQLSPGRMTNSSNMFWLRTQLYY